MHASVRTVTTWEVGRWGADRKWLGRCGSRLLVMECQPKGRQTCPSALEPGPHCRAARCQEQERWVVEASLLPAVPPQRPGSQARAVARVQCTLLGLPPQCALRAQGAPPPGFPGQEPARSLFRPGLVTLQGRCCGLELVWRWPFLLLLPDPLLSHLFGS